MSRVKVVFARVILFGFAAMAAVYSLFISWAGRLNVEPGEPDGLIRALSGLARSVKLGGIAERLERLNTWDLLLAALLFAGVIFFGELCFRGLKREGLRNRIQKWITPALLLFAAVWVILRLNNMSLYAWNNYLGGNNGYPLTGSARFLRWDEYCLWTPMALSQESQGWPGVSTLIGNGTDVTWVSMGGLPAWNAATVFKPLYWGFLLLGADRGLSFLCVSRLVLLFIVSRKTALLYTRNNKGMSLLAAVILTLSPMIQWFFSQSIAEVFIFGQGMILAVHGLLRSESAGKRILYALLNGWLLGCLVMIGYPAWLIPAAIIILVSGAVLFTRPDVKERGKKLGILLAGLLPALAVLGVIVYSSWDTLQAIRNSIYPGSRLITGGLQDSGIITGRIWNPDFKIGLASIFYPLNNVEFNVSNCIDTSPLLTFAPAGFVLSVYHQWKARKADRFEIAVTAVMAVFWLFTFIKLPEWLCKITLLSQCSRPVFPISICEIILLVRARAKGGLANPWAAAAAAVISAGFNLFCILDAGIIRLGTIQLAAVIILYLFVFVLIYMDFKPDAKRLAVFFLCCVLLLAGGFVNPVQQGIDMLSDFELVSTLESIEDEPDDIYAVEGGYPLTNVPLIAGKHCINTDQPYADFERWTAIDPDRENADAYNRLCHVIVTLAEPGEETSFRADDEIGNHLYATLTREDLAALGVTYLVTPRAELENATLVAVDEADGLYVWKLEGGQT